MTLLPAGGVGDLEGCPFDAPVYLVEIGPDGISAAARWNARLTNSLTLADPDPRDLLPTTWVERHPGGWQARAGQVFIPVSELAQLPKHEWLFANELVPKGARGGRRFAPRAPVLIRLPD
jgi:hypothetical protein